MIAQEDRLPLTRQCQLLGLNRSTVYYRHAPISDEDLTLMHRIDEMHLKRPFYGSRRIRDWLQDEGHAVNRKRVQRLMRLMGITALYPKPRTSKHIQSRVRQGDYTHIGINSAKRIVFSRNGGLCKCIEEGRFTYVWQSDNTAFETHNPPPWIKSGRIWQIAAGF